MSFDSKRFMNAFNRLNIKTTGTVLKEAPLIEIKDDLVPNYVYSRIERLVFDLDEIFEEFKKVIDSVYWPEFFSFLSWKLAEMALDLDEINGSGSEGAEMLNLVSMAFNSAEQASVKKESKSIENIPEIVKAVKAVESMIDTEIPLEDRAEAMRITGSFLIGLADYQNGVCKIGNN